MSYKILAINPGSTSTKIGYYEDEKEMFSENVMHSDEELKQYSRVVDEFDMRKDNILNAMKKHGADVKDLSAVVGRGGQLTQIHAGGYRVTEDMKKKLTDPATVEHASNLGALIADAIASPLGIPAYIYDAVGSDEMKDIAKITGMPEVVRASFCHVLNSKAMCRKAAKEFGKTYQEMNFLVAHLGGGISISAHEKGRIIDVITSDGGPFSPERAGSIPLNYIIDMCYSGEYTKREMQKKETGMGGIKAYLGTSNCIEVEHMVEEGNKEAEKIYKAQAYQIAKGIGELSPTLKGNTDAIILTGGVAHSKMLTDWITEYVSFIAPVKVMAGENELESLSMGALRILKGEEMAEDYRLR
ncbi:butyrate kinase [Blautia liquoris]|uniref:Probable butyrate kinase n=1 Tax=Blautia liquoris TaxID=2779518 RepID=A0A7M2RDG3_9FIRM|nr:butyrate kinase [Blautia liquoris]QOV18359.1 butyrate kinase [Blautia liquoris]